MIMRLVALLSLAILSAANGANILVFMPFPAMSHHRVIIPIVEELVSRGHNVTLFSPFTFENASYKIVNFPSYMQKLREVMGLEQESDFMKDGIFNILYRNPVVALRTMGNYFTESLLQEKSFQELIASDSTFDLVIHESMFACEAEVVLQHRFQAITVELMTFGNSHWAYWLHGNPYDTSYICDASMPGSDHMNFLERVMNTFISVGTRLYWYSQLSLHQNMLDRYVHYPGWESRPPLTDMISNISLVLINMHHALNYPYPMSPNFKEIAGTNIHPNKPLPKDIKDFMDNAKEGVIYFTLGSHIQVSSTLGESLQNEFIKAFSKLKQRVLWKWETEFKNPPSNVKISKWFPQQDILAHPNVRLFITHGGFLSMTEAVYHAVPLIGIPILGDQNKNVKTFTNHGYGLHLAYNNLSEPSISWAINEVISNQRYRKAAQERSKLLRDTPMSPVDTAAFWIEYVLRNGGGHLRPAVTKLKWFQSSLIDVYLFLAVILLLPMYIFYKIAKFTMKCLCGKNKKVTIKEKTS